MASTTASAEIEPNNTTAQATNLALPARVSVVIGSAGDREDPYRGGLQGTFPALSQWAASHSLPWREAAHPAGVSRPAH